MVALIRSLLVGAALLGGLGSACRVEPTTGPAEHREAEAHAPGATPASASDGSAATNGSPASHTPSTAPPAVAEPFAADETALARAQPVGPREASPPRSSPSSAYDRDAWRHWIDADDDCQDTRTEVLIAESEIPVTFDGPRKCNVSSGRWTCPCSGQVVTDPHELDIDHTVALRNAHDSGGHAWDAERRQAYANDLDDPAHLVAMHRTANREKGARGPEEWLCPNEAYVCEQVASWHEIKRRWNLSMTAEEAEFVEELRRWCATSPSRARPITNEEAGGTDDSGAGGGGGSCCKVCRKGKACGDTCIAANRACTVGPGCACDG
jgi:hypothetical protein